MGFRPPAAVDDFRDIPGGDDLRKVFEAVWNDENNMGGYVSDAARRSRNYVDPRQEPATGEPVKVPWNGFPRALSRWFSDDQSTSAKEKAEETADIPTPIFSWVQPSGDGLQLFTAEQHRVPLFGPAAVTLARPLREVLPNGTLGVEIPRFRRQQDEYLEWHAVHDGQGRLQSIAFTAEPPDYWIALAQVAPDRMVDLYQKLVSSDVTKRDLFFQNDAAAFGIDENGEQQWFTIPGLKGTYNELNAWTTTKGLVHLTHRANTLGAEVRLASDASHIWGSDGADPPKDIPPEVVRIACGGYGGINRSSDPLIGRDVGKTVRGGARITLTDPVGLYIANADLGSLRGPQGEPIGNQARIFKRGDDDPFDPRILRFEVRLPDGTPFGLEDCTFDSRALHRGGQIARQTTMHLYANAYASGGNTNSKGCTGHVCRHPQRDEVFFAADAGDACPKADSLDWLRETPFEGGTAVGAPRGVVVAAAPARLSKMTVAPGPKIAMSRAPAER
jgi:hypothetical protein